MNIDLVWIELILIFLGLTVFIIAFFKPRDNVQQLEEKIESLFDDFITQVDLENEEMLNKIKLAQNNTPAHIDERLNKIEQKLEQLEQIKYLDQLKQTEQSEQTEKSVGKPVVINHKYEEIIKLYQNGEDIDKIAKKMQMGHAEIMLILELSKKGFNYV